MIKTQVSLNMLKSISEKMHGTTFHHHSHFLYDLPMRKNGYYVEIGCFAGATACLMLQRENINVISIDLGHPIPQEIVHKNVRIFNQHKNSYTYLQGNSQTPDMVNRLKEITQEIDILFIDGDHTKQGVMNDFMMYHKMVVPGGYIVFDDYNDFAHSPEVKPIVDSIAKDTDEYEIIGAVKNTFRAKPEHLTEGNCFVMRKLQ